MLFGVDEKDVMECFVTILLRISSDEPAREQRIEDEEETEEDKINL